MANTDAVVRAAVIQVSSRADVEANLSAARWAMGRAAQAKATVSVFPEVYLNDLTAAAPNVSPARRALVRDSATVLRMCALAREFGHWLVFGFVETADGEKVHNTSLVVSPRGEVVALYRKTHLYDAFGVRESAVYAPGDELFAPLSTPFAALGLLVCYELRFPEIARVQVLRGAQLLIVPSAWYAGTGKVRQWQALVSARALENSCYVLACNQAVGSDAAMAEQSLEAPGQSPYCGHSMVVDPSGEVIGQLGEGEDVLICDIDLSRIGAVRASVPALNQRRPSLYPDLL
ncbi:MAG: carbon-nitrogen hydrolase family protein [Firmicutes bacterium]|nr:carbon-nitrogen hydrolase family protein [Bacillota bacterium]